MVSRNVCPFSKGRTFADIPLPSSPQGLMMHRKYSQERLMSQHSTPFLVQQRQALYKRPVPLNTSLNISPAL